MITNELIGELFEDMGDDSDMESFNEVVALMSKPLSVNGPMSLDNRMWMVFGYLICLRDKGFITEKMCDMLGAAVEEYTDIQKYEQFVLNKN